MNPQVGIPPDSTVCMETVTVSVSGGATPTFSWSPTCKIGRLIVEQGLDEYWGTETPGDNSYHSPIVYGVHPPGSVEYQAPIALQPGQTYLVSLWVFITVTPESLLMVGSKEFTP